VGKLTVSLLLKILVGALTLGLPLLFAFLDTRAFPNLRWIGEGHPSPAWGRSVVLVGIVLAVLIALAEPMAGFHPEH
jgi:hypothetical protein